jgi:hypothetical protein
MGVDFILQEEAAKLVGHRQQSDSDGKSVSNKTINIRGPPEIGRQGVNLAAPKPFALRIEHAVRYSGLSKSTLYGLIASNKIASVKRAGRRLLLTASLEDFIIGRSVEP